MESPNSQRSFLQVCLSRSWGGLEMVAAEFAQSLKDKGFPSAVLCPKNSPLDQACRQRGIPTYHMELKKRPSWSRSREVRRILDERKVSHVCIHHLKDLWIVTPALWGRSEVKAIGFSHTFLNYRKRDLFHRLLYGRLDQLVALTERHARNLMEYLPLKEQQLTQIPNSVDVERFHPRHRSEEIRQQLGVGPDDFLIGVVGRLDPQKGQMETLEAARLLRDRNLRFQLVFVGEETKNTRGLGQQMKDKIEQDQLGSCVKMLGFQENPAGLMASLDLFVMPSYGETFGKVLLEAMSSETPVVATNAGGVPDIITHGVEGLLIEPRSAQAIANGIEQMLGDLPAAKAMGKAGRERVLRQFSTTVVQAQIDRLLLH